MDLLVVGSVALDTVQTDAAHHEDILGGSASFTSVAASRFASTGIVAVVGDDFPTPHVDLLQRQGVDTGGLEVTPGRTFRWAGRYHTDMNQRDTLSTELGVFEAFEPKLPADTRSAPVLFLGNIHPALQGQVLDQMTGQPFVGLDTMNFWIEGTPDALKAVLPRVDVLLINDEEARLLSGCSGLREAAAAVRALGPRYLVIKRGEYGALLFGDDELFWVPALLLDEVVDPTGAGDSFAGGFMGYLASQPKRDKRTLREAMVHGTVVASFTVQGFSLEGLLAARPELYERRRQELLAMTQLR